MTVSDPLDFTSSNPSSLTSPSTPHPTHAGNSFTASAVSSTIAGSAAATHRTAFGSAGGAAIAAADSADSKHEAAQSTPLNSLTARLTPLNDEVRNEAEDAASQAKELIDLRKEGEFKDQVNEYVLNENRARLKNRISPMKWLAIVAVVAGVIAFNILFPPSILASAVGAIWMLSVISMGGIGLLAFIRFLHSFNVNASAEGRFKEALKLLDDKNPKLREEFFNNINFKREVARVKNDYNDTSEPTSMLTLKQRYYSIGSKVGFLEEYDKPDELNRAAHDISGLQFDERYLKKFKRRQAQIERGNEAQEKYTKAIKAQNAKEAKEAAAAFQNAKELLMGYIDEDNEWLQKNYHLKISDEATKDFTEERRAVLNFAGKVERMSDNTPFNLWPSIHMTQPEHVKDIRQIKEQDYAYNSPGASREAVSAAAKKWKELSVDPKLYELLKKQRELKAEILNLRGEYNILRESPQATKEIMLSKAQKLAAGFSGVNEIILKIDDTLSREYSYNRPIDKKNRETAVRSVTLQNFRDLVAAGSPYPEVPLSLIPGNVPSEEPTIKDYNYQIETINSDILRLQKELAAKEQILQVPPSPPLTKEETENTNREIMSITKQIDLKKAERTQQETLRAKLETKEEAIKAKLDAIVKARAEADVKVEAASRAHQQDKDDAASAPEDAVSDEREKLTAAEEDAKVKAKEAAYLDTAKAKLNSLTLEEIENKLLEFERWRKQQIYIDQDVLVEFNKLKARREVLLNPMEHLESLSPDELQKLLEAKKKERSNINDETPQEVIQKIWDDIGALQNHLSILGVPD